MDIYQSDSLALLPRPCIVFVFGGGFKEGTRDYEKYSNFFNYFANKGFVVVSIDYRLGMKDQSAPRSEEHTSELQSRPHLVCRLLLEKKKKKKKNTKKYLTNTKT